MKIVAGYAGKWISRKMRKIFYPNLEQIDECNADINLDLSKIPLID